VIDDDVLRVHFEPDDELCGQLRGVIERLAPKG